MLQKGARSLQHRWSDTQRHGQRVYELITSTGRTLTKMGVNVQCCLAAAQDANLPSNILLSFTQMDEWLLSYGLESTTHVRTIL